VFHEETRFRGALTLSALNMESGDAVSRILSDTGGLKGVVGPRHLVALGGYNPYRCLFRDLVADGSPADVSIVFRHAVQCPADQVAAPPY